jgi:hypothetical protein
VYARVVVVVVISPWVLCVRVVVVRLACVRGVVVRVNVL